MTADQGELFSLGISSENLPATPSMQMLGAWHCAVMMTCTAARVRAYRHQEPDSRDLADDSSRSRLPAIVPAMGSQQLVGDVRLRKSGRGWIRSTIGDPDPDSRVQGMSRDRILRLASAKRITVRPLSV